MDGGVELWKKGGLRDWGVVRAEDEFSFGSERNELFYGGKIRRKIGFRPIEPDFAGIVGVSGEEQAIGAID